MTQNGSPPPSLHDVALAARDLADRLDAARPDWMGAANAESARVLSTLAMTASSASVRRETTNGVETRHPLIAIVGAADLALATVTDIMAALRSGADAARTDAQARVDDGRVRVSKLRAALSTYADALRSNLDADKVRDAVEAYAAMATTTYERLIERGEETLTRARDERLRLAGITDGYRDLPDRAVADTAAKIAADIVRDFPRVAVGKGSAMSDLAGAIRAADEGSRTHRVIKRTPATRVKATARRVRTSSDDTGR